jgi:D-amino-acid oxidase
MVRRSDVTVIGAGVSGLTTGVRLAEAGHRVRILTATGPDATTSCAAGAIWGPHMVAHDRADIWAKRSLLAFQEMAAVTGTGVEIVAGVEASRGRAERPDWASMLGDFTECPGERLPPGFRTGFGYSVPIIDMPRYLHYLEIRFGTAGGTLELIPPIAAGRLGDLGPVVVNCAGLGAGELTGDTSIEPIAGDLLIAANPGISTFFVEQDSDTDRVSTYVLPQGDTVILGGSRRAPDEPADRIAAILDEIWRRCVATIPALAAVRPVDHRWGLRPVRHRVRLDAEEAGGTLIVHNYGHGGAGVTLSWGCADDVLEIVESA